MEVRGDTNKTRAPHHMDYGIGLQLCHLGVQSRACPLRTACCCLRAPFVQTILRRCPIAIHLRKHQRSSKPLLVARHHAACLRHGSNSVLTWVLPVLISVVARAVHKPAAAGLRRADQGGYATRKGFYTLDRSGFDWWERGDSGGFFFSHTSR